MELSFFIYKVVYLSLGLHVYVLMLHLKGSEKVPENIWQLTRSVYNLMTSLNGQIHVRFGKPKSFEVSQFVLEPGWQNVEVSEKRLSMGAEAKRKNGY